MDIDIESPDFDTGEIERNFAIQDAVRQLTRRLNSHIEASESRRQAESLVADAVIASSLCVVEMAFIQRQETAEVMQLSSPSWQPDREPEPSVLDTWVRGNHQNPY